MYDHILNKPIEEVQDELQKFKGFVGRCDDWHRNAYDSRTLKGLAHRIVMRAQYLEQMVKENTYLPY